MQPKIWLALGLAAAVGSGCGAPAAAPPVADEAVTARKGDVSAVQYHDEWRKLWEDHITWTRMVIVAVVNDLPGEGEWTGRLLQNVVDMEDALLPYFDEDDVDEFGDLLLEHLVLAKQILDTVRQGGDPQALIAAWRVNGTELAVKMNEMNPDGWPLAETEAMWQDHLVVTLDEALANFGGDFVADVAVYESVHVMALEMADLFSGGIIQQRDAKFRLEVCVP